MPSLQDRYNEGVVANAAAFQDLVLMETHKVLAWSSATSYNKGDLCYNGGSIYRSIYNGVNLNHPTNDTNYWENMGAGAVNDTNIGKAMMVKDLGQSIINTNAQLTTLTNNTNADGLHKHSLDSITVKNDIMLKSTYDTNSSGTVDVADVAQSVFVPTTGTAGDFYVIGTTGTAGWEHRDLLPPGAQNNQVLAKVDDAYKWVDIVDDLDSTNGSAVLSANQGRVLKDMIETSGKAEILVTTTKFNVGDTVTATSQESGKVLTGTFNAYKKCVFDAAYGVWIIEATNALGTMQKSVNIEILQRYTVNIEPVELYAFMIDDPANQSDPGYSVYYPNKVYIGNDYGTSGTFSRSDFLGCMNTVTDNGAWLGAPTPGEEDIGLNSNDLTVVARLDTTTDVFNYGKWQHAFFIDEIKPCMLYYNGTVAYYLNKNNYLQKEDGSPSAITEPSFGGNAMIEIPQIWMRYYTVNDSGRNRQYVLVSNKKLDDYFYCWTHYNRDNKLVNYVYKSIYMMSAGGRSIGGTGTYRPCTVRTTAQTEVTNARLNNSAGGFSANDDYWYTDVIADWMMFQNLGVLISKSLDSQSSFGVGLCNWTSGEPTYYCNQFNLGMFSGKHTATGSDVSFFGMVNPWGMLWNRVAGLVLNGTSGLLYKMTYGVADGTTQNGYGLDYATTTGYKNVSWVFGTGNTSQWVKNYTMINNTTTGIPGFRYPTLGSGGASSGTYYCDNCWYNTTQFNYAHVLGSSFYGLSDGLFCLYVGNVPSVTSWDDGAALSFKPPIGG